MSDRTAEPAFRAGDSQDHRQRGSVRHDTEDETSEPSDSKPIIQESDTEKLIIVKSDSDEEMQGEDVDEEMVMTSIVVNANDEEEAANKHDFVMAWVKTQRIECLHSTTVVH